MGRPRSSPDGLAPRERQLLTLAAEGLGDREIADRLGISKNTVGSYWKRLYERHGWHKRSEAIACAISNGQTQSLGPIVSDVSTPSASEIRPIERSKALAERSGLLGTSQYLEARRRGDLAMASNAVLVVATVLNDPWSPSAAISWHEMDRTLADLLRRLSA